MTFGGFVGMSNYLTIFFNTEYGLPAVRAADFTTVCVIAGSFFRPIGGFLSDRIGGIRMLTILYAGAFAMFALVSTLPSLSMVIVLLFVGMMCLGAGNSSVFQLVPQRFGGEIGLVTGIVGAAGGLGGYALPLLLGSLYQSTGSYTPGFLVIGGIALACFALLFIVQGTWKRTWSGQGGIAKVEKLGQAS